jgi:hypothetical protein
MNPQVYQPPQQTGLQPQYIQSNPGQNQTFQPQIVYTNQPGFQPIQNQNLMMQPQVVYTNQPGGFNPLGGSLPTNFCCCPARTWVLIMAIVVCVCSVFGLIQFSILSYLLASLSFTVIAFNVFHIVGAIFGMVAFGSAGGNNGKAYTIVFLVSCCIDLLLQIIMMFMTLFLFGLWFFFFLRIIVDVLGIIATALYMKDFTIGNVNYSGACCSSLIKCSPTSWKA